MTAASGITAAGRQTPDMRGANGSVRRTGNAGILGRCWSPLLASRCSAFFRQDASCTSGCRQRAPGHSQSGRSALLRQHASCSSRCTELLARVPKKTLADCIHLNPGLKSSEITRTSFWIEYFWMSRFADCRASKPGFCTCIDTTLWLKHFLRTVLLAS